ncbi:MAG: prepilin-type N-terminal cleavage/methylation domain-containing protein [Verrucomicrobiota bacterium]
MKIKPLPSGAKGTRAFSLVELLTVILIIAILVALVVGVAGYAEQKAAYEKAKGQMALIKSTLSAYKDHWGEYPRSPGGNYSGETGARILYQVLTGDGDNLLGGSSGSNGRIDQDEMNIKPRPPLDPVHDRQGMVRKEPNGNIGTILLDPFGNPWNYRPAEDGDSETLTRNKTYDLWSFGSDSTRGKEAKWITNWSGS